LIYEKSPQQKKRNRCLRLRLLTGGCAALLSRFFSLFLRRLRRLLLLPSPRFSLLLWAAAPPLLFASPLALLSGGCAALPLPFLFLFSSLLRRLVPPTPLPFPVYFSIMARGLQVINFFSFAIIA
jgi:hypothetical protein